MTVKLLTLHHLEFLCLKGGCTGSSESTLVKMPHCWKSHDMALNIATYLYCCMTCQIFHICEKVYFDQLLDFRILLLLFLHTLLLCHILLFGCWIFLIPCGCQTVWIQIRPDLGPNCLQRLSADIAGKELNTKQLVDTFWLKPWLKLILGSFMQTKYLCVLIHILIKGEVGAVKLV